MAASGTTLWSVRAGEASQADSLFLQEGYIAMGWNSVGDLSAIPNDQEAFRKHIRVAYPQDKAGAIAINAGQLRRFTYEVKPGDYVAYPSRIDRMIHLGRIVGSYQYDPKLDPHYPHQRKVEWLKAVSRTHFTPGALYEMGYALAI